jgi:hypothetical protein
MPIFAVLNLLKTIVDSGRGKTVWELTLSIVEGEDENHAEFKGRAIGKKNETIFQNEHDQDVEVKFVDIISIERLADNNISDGVEGGVLMWEGSLIDSGAALISKIRNSE